MSAPRISVIVPNHNHARLLPRCLTALLNQPVRPLEILVIDDASTDDSLEVLKAWAGDPIVQVIRNPENLGVTKTMNRGLELARGDYVFFAAADDEVKPGIFEQASRMLSAHPGAGLCGGLCEWRCTSTGLHWLVGGGMPAQAGYLSPDEMVRLGRQGKLSIASQTAIFKKSALLEAGGWLPELRWFCDFFGSFVVGFRHGICHVPEVQAVFYLYPTSYYNASADAAAERRETMRRLLERLEEPRCADVAPRLRKSGVLGAFGWPMAAAIVRTGRWKFLTLPFLLRTARRWAETVGRRFFPPRLARLCLRLFYGRR